MLETFPKGQLIDNNLLEPIQENANGQVRNAIPPI